MQALDKMCAYIKIRVQIRNVGDSNKGNGSGGSRRGAFPNLNNNYDTSPVKRSMKLILEFFPSMWFYSYLFAQFI